MNKHFFLIEEVKITRYAINNYEDIKTLNKWNEIYTKEKKIIAILEGLGIKI